VRFISHPKSYQQSSLSSSSIKTPRELSTITNNLPKGLYTVAV
jgi:hypothetical protein